jgi:hypothetical protein
MKATRRPTPKRPTNLPDTYKHGGKWGDRMLKLRDKRHPPPLTSVPS